MSDQFINKAKPKRTRKSGRGASMRAVEENSRAKFIFPKKSLLSLLGLGLTYVLIVNFQNFYEKLNTQKIEKVVIEESLNYVSEEEVKLAVYGFINQALVVIDLDEIKQTLELNPWIKSVGLKREWPGTLIISVKEEMAIARWGEGQLLNQEGRIFSPKTELNQTHLPYLSGPLGSEQAVMEMYEKFTQLLYPQALRIVGLDLNTRNAWSIELEDSVKIRVGNEQIMERMNRFVEFVDSTLIESLASINTIDLRYQNGVAVSKKSAINGDVVSL